MGQLKEISDIEISHEDIFYGQTTYRATYESDHGITDAEAQEFIRTTYHGFPYIEADYTIKGNTITIDYTIDDCE